MEWATCKALQDISAGAWRQRLGLRGRGLAELMPTITAVQFEIATWVRRDGRKLIHQPELVHVTNGEQRGVPPRVVGVATEGV